MLNSYLIFWECRPYVPSALFFKYNTALGPPYRVLVDTNFINFSIQNKVRYYSILVFLFYFLIYSNVIYCWKIVVAILELILLLFKSYSTCNFCFKKIVFGSVWFASSMGWWTWGGDRRRLGWCFGVGLWKEILREAFCISENWNRVLGRHLLIFFILRKN